MRLLHNYVMYRRKYLNQISYQIILLRKGILRKNPCCTNTNVCINVHVCVYILKGMYKIDLYLWNHVHIVIVFNFKYEYN